MEGAQLRSDLLLSQFLDAIEGMLNIITGTLR